MKQQEEGEQNRKEGGLEEQAWPVHLAVGPSSLSTSESQKQSHLKLRSVPFWDHVSNPEKTFTLKWILKLFKISSCFAPPPLLLKENRNILQPDRKLVRGPRCVSVFVCGWDSCEGLLGKCVQMVIGERRTLHAWEMKCKQQPHHPRPGSPNQGAAE